MSDKQSHYFLAKEEVSYYESDASLQNLLAVLIGNKATPEVTGLLASKGVKNLMDMRAEDFAELKGIGEIASLRIQAALSLAEHTLRFIRPTNSTVRSPQDTVDYVPELRHQSYESFVVLYLNTKYEVILKKELFKGSLSACHVHPREVFSEALRVKAAAIICIHNHPSGDPKPSPEDIDLTKRLKEAGSIIGIDTLDHVIIANDKYYSFAQEGIM